ncbi:MAG: hypothetical protein D6765_09385, partial [Bacteroidetes bacterium]
MNTRMLLAFHPDNRPHAERIEQNLKGTGLELELLSAEPAAPDDAFARRLADFPGKVLLLVTDNFLKEAACLDRLLPALQNVAEGKGLLPVVAPGEGPEGPVETRFEKVSDIIQYMNHWQEAYLALRRERRQLPPEKIPAFDVKVERVKGISNAIGELLRFLRSVPHIQLEQLESSDYEALFRFAGLSPQTPTPADTPSDPAALVDLIQSSSEDVLEENDAAKGGRQPLSIEKLPPVENQEEPPNNGQRAAKPAPDSAFDEKRFEREIEELTEIQDSLEGEAEAPPTP